MIKKTLLAMLLLSAAGAMVFGAATTGAWFTAQARLDNSAISTGTLDLEVSGGPFSAARLEPGTLDYTSLGWFCVRNNGDFDMKWRGWMVDVKDAQGLSNYLVVRAVLNPPEHPGNTGPQNDTLFEDIPFSALTTPGTFFLMDDPAAPFKPGQEVCYDVQVRLLGAAPNAIQGAAAAAGFYIEGTQRANSGWEE